MAGIFLSGLAAGLALIVAIGAQNAYVLRQGVLRRHVLLVVAVCMAGDILLIGLGTLGVGAVVRNHPRLFTVIAWAGAAYLLWFAVMSLRSAARPHALQVAAEASAGSVLATTLALTFLNPHVYLDTVVMLGSLANSYSGQRWTFAAGAVTASIVWFTSLGLGARLMATPLSKPRVWRVIDVLIAVIMVTLAVRLVAV